ncbi:MAG: rhomboid family intramembrane serine protease [Bacteroidales bacterium]|nr:rhomboid family intramembrane serine protease [Bacteroidales bacterium]MDZ4203664.1 rhomboid family intramembrane serine protease [Bacteroidales bacterium]
MNDYYRPMGFRVLPPVVKNLLILNGLFFLATLAFQSAFNIDLIDKLGLHYITADKFNPIQFVTYMFLHGGFTHILFNMFALWMFGNTLENIWGPKRFLIYYLATGIGAAIIHYITIYFSLQPTLALLNSFLSEPGFNNLQQLVVGHKFQINQYSGEIYGAFRQFDVNYKILQGDPGNYTALQGAVEFLGEYKAYYLNLPNVVGASGAVFGILLAFGMMFPNSIIYIYFAFPIKAKWFVIIYGAIELYLGISGRGGNVAHFAHLGGMIFGYFLIIYWRRTDRLKFF